MSLGENKTLKLKRGDIFFIPSFFDIKFETSESISIWVAAANGMGFELEAKEKDRHS
jgi:hypothetical protein